MNSDGYQKIFDRILTKDEKTVTLKEIIQDIQARAVAEHERPTFAYTGLTRNVTACLGCPEAVLYHSEPRCMLVLRALVRAEVVRAGDWPRMTEDDVATMDAATVRQFERSPVPPNCTRKDATDAYNKLREL